MFSFTLRTVVFPDLVTLSLCNTTGPFGVETTKESDLLNPLNALRLKKNSSLVSFETESTGNGHGPP